MLNKEKNQAKKQAKEKIKKEALSLTEKNRKKIKIWYLLIYLFLATALAFSTFIAIYKHQKAMASLNKANEIMMTNTGIVIDSVNIKSFQEAEYILSEKEKIIEMPDSIRNIFMFNAWIKINNKEAPSLTSEDEINLTEDLELDSKNTTTTNI